MARAFFFLFIFMPVTLICSTAAIIGSLLDKSGTLPYRCAILWSRIALALAGVKLVVKGLEQVPTGQPIIFMGNHQSNFDVPSLFLAVPVKFSWIAKEELFRIPVFGHSMRRAGYIPVDPHGGRRAHKSLDDAATKIREGRIIVIFPEGTRSKDGSLLPFKKGGFLLASKAGVQVVPFTINGSIRINPPPTLYLRPGTVTITFSAPIPPEPITEKLMAEVHTAISSRLEPA